MHKRKRPQSNDVQWPCSLCTFLNAAHSMRCAMCETSRDHGGSVGGDAEATVAWTPQENNTHSVSTRERKKRNQSTTSNSFRSLSLSSWLSDKRNSTITTRPPKAEGSSQCIDVISSDSNDSDDDKLASRRPVRSGKSQQLSRTSRDRELWVDKYQPSRMEDLCIHKKKLDEIVAWFERNVLRHQSPTSCIHHQRILFLCGPPGIGKSTMVRCLCRHFDVGIQEWHDATGISRLRFQGLLHDQFRTSNVSAFDDFADFLHRSQHYAALPLVAARAETRKRRRPQAQSQDQVILIEQWPQSWRERDESEYRLQTLLVDVVGAAQQRFPLVFIFSDVRERKADVKQLARVFGCDVVFSPLTSVINVNPVTTAQMKKCLLRIAKQERMVCDDVQLSRILVNSNGDMRHAVNLLQFQQFHPPPNPRSMISSYNARRPTLTTSRSRSKSNRKSKSQSCVSDDEEEAQEDDQETEEDSVGHARDTFCSELHLIGKVLHRSSRSKSMGSGDADTARFSRLDSLLEACSMQMDQVTAFLHENCLEFFTSIDDLVEALEVFSFSDQLLSESFKTNAASEVLKLSRDVVRSLVVRSIDLTNQTPAQSAFRPITKPQSNVFSKDSQRRQPWLNRNSSPSETSQASTALEAMETMTFSQLIRGPTDGSNARRNLPNHQTGLNPEPTTLSLLVETEDEIDDSEADDFP